MKEKKMGKILIVELMKISKEETKLNKKLKISFQSPIS